MRAYRKYVLTMCMVWAASFVLFAAAYFLVVFPQLKVKAQLVKESAEKQRMYEDALDAAKEESKKKLAAEVEALKSKLGDYVTDFGDTANVTLEISRIAADKSVGAFSIKTGDPSRDSEQIDVKNLRENRIEISFLSDFRQFATLLNALERHRPVIFVDRFKILRGQEDVMSNKVDMDLSIFVKKRQEG
jgi:hypothetical protein